MIEHCAEPYSDGLWHKWGTFRIGSTILVDHIAVDTNWCVKYGVWKKLTDAAILDEHDAVKSNRYAAALTPIFDIAGSTLGGLITQQYLVRRWSMKSIPIPISDHTFQTLSHFVGKR